MMKFETHIGFATALDEADPLKKFRAEFLFPKRPSGRDALYFTGNSLGLEPRKVREYVNEELDDWAKYGVEGHLTARHPWLPYHEFLTEPLARIVGAKPNEVVAMNTLSVNVHLLMVSFYRPTKTRNKIIIEWPAFPSDRYAVCSQIQFHGYDPKDCLVELKPRPGEHTLRKEDILETIKREGEQLALVMIGNVNYLTGQAFNMKEIAQAGHAVGAKVGFDLAHGAGNLDVKLHDSGVDFACWCSYKYLNGGPGALGGIFIHEKNLSDPSIPRFAGWWGHNKERRFKMEPDYSPIPTAEAWQLSNPPILQLAALRASFEIFDEAGIANIRKKSELITSYFEFLVKTELGDKIEITTPQNVSERGAQLSLLFKGIDQPAELVKKLTHDGVFVDFRMPNLVRAAPAPLYTRYQDVYELVETLKQHS